MFAHPDVSSSIAAQWRAARLGQSARQQQVRASIPAGRRVTRPGRRDLAFHLERLSALADRGDLGPCGRTLVHRFVRTAAAAARDAGLDAPDAADLGTPVIVQLRVAQRIAAAAAADRRRHRLDDETVLRLEAQWADIAALPDCTPSAVIDLAAAERQPEKVSLRTPSPTLTVPG